VTWFKSLFKTDEPPSLQLTDDLRRTFENYRKSHIAIVANAVSMEEIALGESRFGGLPDVPQGFEWPAADGQRLGFIAQIAFKDTKPYDTDDVLPANGHLFVFYEGGEKAWGFRPDDHRYWSIFYVPQGTPLVRTLLPDSTPDFATIKPGRLTFGHGSSYADPWDFDVKDLTADERFRFAEYQQELDQSDLPAHHLLGYSNNVQGDMKLECQLASNGIDVGDADGYQDPRAKGLEPGAADWRLLLQFDTDEGLDIMWGDVGMIYVWIRKQDLADKRFDKARICFQCS
jgi:uncharacterized protein YwqG